VEQEENFMLEPEQLARGFRLSCITRPTSDCTVRPRAGPRLHSINCEAASRSVLSADG
jgi:ferredoxin